MKKLHKGILSALIICLPFWIWVGWALSATYYVDTNADPGGDGTTSATTGANCAWDTIADVNAASFSPGDSILFNRGCTWREQLTIPSSGSEGSSITFGAYGTGDDPVISGADLVSTWAEDLISGLLESDANTVAIWNFNDALTDASGNSRTLTDNGSIAYSNSEAPFDKYAVFDGSTDYFSYSDTQEGDTNAFDFGANSFTIEIWVRIPSAVGGGTTPRLFSKGAPGQVRYEIFIDGTNNYAKLIMYDGTNVASITGSDIDDNNWHHVALRADYDNQIDNNLSFWIDGVEQGVSVSLAAWDAVDNNYNFTVGATTGGANKLTGQIEQIKVSNTAITSFPSTPSSGVENVWNASVTTEPNIVIFDGAHGTGQASKAACTSAGDWFWVGEILSIYSESDPDTAFTDPGIEVGKRDYCIFGDGKTYITIDDLKFQHSNTTSFGNITAYGPSHNWIVMDCFTGPSSNDGISIIGNNTQILNSEGTRASRFGLNLGGSNLTNALVDKCVFYENGASSITVISQNATIQNSIFHDDGWNTAAQAHAVYLYNYEGIGANGTIIQDNKMYGYDDGDEDSAIRCSGDSIQIRRNNIYDSNFGISLVDTEFTCDDNEIYYNKFSSIATSTIYAEGAKDSQIYNNTFYSDGSDGSNGILVFANGTNQHCSGNVTKNNIFYGATYHIRVFDGEGTGFISDYNLFYPDTETKFQWGDTAYNFTDWKTNSGQDANSISADPQFTDPTNGDFTLKSNSPCIDAGTNLGATYDDAIVPFSVWPNNVSTDDQDKYGTGWEIGAYLYPFDGKVRGLNIQ